MWIGSIRLVVETVDGLTAPAAGTDNLVQATIVRDGTDLRVFNFDYPNENDLEPGAIRAYDYMGPTKLPRRNDKTPELPPGIGKSPMPYPGYGFEFSNGMKGHLKIRLRINGDDLWIKDNVDFYVRRILPPNGITGWQEEANWTYVASWGKDVTLSTDSGEGVTTWLLNLT